MNIERFEKAAFVVVGKKGSTLDGAGFIPRLWDDANSHFGEVQHLAKRDEKGNLIGIWGAMSDFSGSFLPWEDFRNGLYLAGVECETDAEAPEGWTKWVVPGYEYLCVEREADDTFSQAIKYLGGTSYPVDWCGSGFYRPKDWKKLYVFSGKAAITVYGHIGPFHGRPNQFYAIISPGVHS